MSQNNLRLNSCIGVVCGMTNPYDFFLLSNQIKQFKVFHSRGRCYFSRSFFFATTHNLRQSNTNTMHYQVLNTSYVKCRINSLHAHFFDNFKNIF